MTRSSTTRRFLVAGATIVGVGLAALPAAAGGTDVPVSTDASSAGTRTLHVTDLTGNDVSSSGLSVNGQQAADFLTTVTDKGYNHAGYQVSATMTNLYPYADGSYDFAGSKIPSSALSVSYPASLLDLTNVTSLVQPVVTLTADALDLGVLGTLNMSQTVDGASQTVANVADTVTQSTLSGVLSKLPVSLATGETGAFTDPAQLPGGPDVTGGSSTYVPTSKVLMSGDAQSLTVSSLVDLLNSALGVTGAGVPVSQLITAGLITQSQVLSAVTQSLGAAADLLTQSQINSLLAGVTAKVTDLVGSVTGQSGSYSAQPELSINVPSSTPGGSYRGQMTVTLMDK